MNMISPRSPRAYSVLENTNHVCIHQMPIQGAFITDLTFFAWATPPMVSLNLIGPSHPLPLPFPGDPRGLITPARIWRSWKPRPCMDSREANSYQGWTQMCWQERGQEVEHRVFPNSGPGLCEKVEPNFLSLKGDIGPSNDRHISVNRLDSLTLKWL